MRDSDINPPVTVNPPQAILRVCYLRHFGYFVGKMQNIQFHFEADKGVFCGPVQLQSQQEDQMAAQQNMVSEHAHNQPITGLVTNLNLSAPYFIFININGQGSV